MAHRGHIEAGAVVLESPIELADGTEVEITPVAQSPTWAEVLKDIIGKAEGLPADSSRNHDLHLYTTSKK